MSAKLTTQEAVMGQVIPRQHPAVVLKSHYKALRALLAVALVAIVALATTVVILANDDNGVTSSAQPAAKTAVHAQTQQQLPAGTRFDGGPDEGTRGPQAPSYWQQANPRTSYEPTPNSGFKERAGGPQMLPIGPGAR
jgi:type II secretory pathway pseudopilin PulG